MNDNDTMNIISTSSNILFSTAPKKTEDSTSWRCHLARHEILKGYIRAAKASMVNYALLDDRSKKRLDVPFIPSPPPVPHRRGVFFGVCFGRGQIGRKK